MKNKIKEALNIKRYKRKINTLENKVEELESIIKNELYKQFMNSVIDTGTIDKYKKENKRLREKIKTLKDIIREEQK